MASLIREALDGFEEQRRGPGEHSFAELMANTHAAAIRFESGWAGDEDDRCQPGDCNAVLAARARGVTVRRLRLLPAAHSGRGPMMLTAEAGDQLRCLSRPGAAGLLLPGADCWVFDYRVIRWDFTDVSGAPERCAFSSDPRIIRDVAAAFEIAWSRAESPGCEHAR